MAISAISDEEFINVFHELGGSPSLMAKRFNIHIRNIHFRRARLEKKLGIELKLTNSQRPEDIKARHDGRIRLHVDDGMVIVFSDAHYYPDLISTSHRALLKFIKQFKPEVVVCNGDAFDGGSISRYPRIGWDNKPTVKQEIEAVKERLDEIEQASKGKLIWTLGNHDARYETYLAANSPQFEGIKGFTLKDHFPRWSPAWSLWIESSNDIPTVIKHCYKGGIHAAHNNAVNSGTHIVTGHLHSLKVTPFSDYQGTRWGVDTGTLADPYGVQFLDYSQDNPKNHRQGFAVLTYKNGRLLPPELVQVWDEDSVTFRGAIVKV